MMNWETFSNEPSYKAVTDRSIRPRNLTRRSTVEQPNTENKVTTYFSLIRSVSCLSQEEFSTQMIPQLSWINALFQKLLNVAPQLGKDISKLKFDIKIIKNRLLQVDSGDEVIKTEILQKMKKLLLPLKSEENPKVEGLVESFGTLSLEDKSIPIEDETIQKTLQFFKKFIETIDDTRLEQLFNRGATIFPLDLASYPKLSVKAPEILLQKCKNLFPKSFQGITESRFCDCALLVGGVQIPVNEKFMCHFMPHFSALFEPQTEYEGGVKLGDGVLVLSLFGVDCPVSLEDPQAVKDCIDAITGLYDPRREKDLNRALAFLRHAAIFGMTSFFESAESAIVTILSSLDPYEINEEMLCCINKPFYVYFKNGLFPLFYRKLSEIAKPIYNRLWDKFQKEYSFERLQDGEREYLIQLTEEKRNKYLWLRLITDFFVVMAEKKFPSVLVKEGPTEIVYKVNVEGEGLVTKHHSVW